MTQAANLGALGTNVSSSGITQIAGGGTAGTAGVTGFKNRIINGNMTIDQRNAGASITPTDGQYSVDRWTGRLTQASKYTLQQNAGSVTPPTGFRNYLGATSSSAYSVGSGDFFLIEQWIEGFNTADLMWGTANAQTVTLSFWVRSSLTGTFGGSLRTYAGGQTYPFSYTISATNTWEYKTVTVTGATSGTWNTTNSGSIGVAFSLGCGSGVSGTAGAWSSSTFLSATGATSVVGTNGATFYITGVQLEVGTAATNFDVRSYGTELQLCQRYFYRHLNASASTGWNPNIVGYRWTANEVYFAIPCPVPLRATPSISKSGTMYIYSGGTSITLGGAIAVPTNYSNFTCYPNVRVTATGITGNNTWGCEYDPNAYFEVSAEL